jgi:HEAT repeat protein
MADSAPDRAALIVQAMADRQDTVVLPAVLTAAKQGPKQVRLSAIDALGRVGDASCLSVLLAIAGETDVDLAQAAKETLADLPSEDINIQIVALLRKAKGEQLPLLLALVGQRRINAVATVLEALDHSNKEVRQAALAALGETITFKDLAVLVSQVVGQKNSQDTGAALQALTAASVRMPDREACAAELATAIAETSSVPTKGSLLEILAAVGGTNALKAMGAAAKSSNPELQDISTRLLGKWMTEDAAPVLLDLAKTAPSKKYQVRALRGYIRIARQFVMPPQRRAAMCEQAFEASQQTAEQRLVLEVLKRYPHSATLKVAIKAMEVPELKDEAAQAILVIVQKIGGKGVNVRELLSKTGLAEVKLEILKAEYGAGSTQMDVTAVIRKHAGDLPLITLPTTSYNTSFGRDPLPGNVKQLRIQYRINGKAGTALFAENALILLPLPK